MSLHSAYKTAEQALDDIDFTWVQQRPVSTVSTPVGAATVEVDLGNTNILVPGHELPILSRQQVSDRLTARTSLRVLGRSVLLRVEGERDDLTTHAQVGDRPERRVPNALSRPLAAFALRRAGRQARAALTTRGATTSQFPIKALRHF